MLNSAIQNFVAHQVERCPWLAEWWEGFRPDTHETQINIDPSGLEPCFAKLSDRKPSYWTDEDGTEHRHIRIPRNSFVPDAACHKDRPVIGPIHRRWAYIGTSGWNWRDRKSEWVGFDFDDITKQNGLTPEQLEEIKHRTLSLPYTTLRTSTGGKGLHVLVRLNPRPTTRSHTEHSQLAKHILGTMSRDCDFSFQASLDVCGLILWHWKLGISDAGLRRIK